MDNLTPPPLLEISDNVSMHYLSWGILILVLTFLIAIIFRSYSKPEDLHEKVSQIVFTRPEGKYICFVYADGERGGISCHLLANLIE